MRTAALWATLLACGGSPSETTAVSADLETGAEATTGGPTSGATTTTDASTTTSTTDTSTTDASTTISATTEDTSTTSATADATTSTTDATTGTTGTTGLGEAETTGTGDASGTTGETTADGTTGEGTSGGAAELGTLSGECGLIDAMELESPSAFVFSNAIDFGAVGFDYDLLTPGGRQIWDEGNLNPGSLASEIVAYEVLARCDGAALLKTEATVVYTNPMGKKTDLLVELDGLKVGVSVVRAVGFPKDDPYTVAQAETILTKKLQDILASSANVAPEDAWVKQILHVVAYGPMHVDSVLAAYAGLDPGLTADTILVVSATNGDDAFIY